MTDDTAGQHIGGGGADKPGDRRMAGAAGLTSGAEHAINRHFAGSTRRRPAGRRAAPPVFIVSGDDSVKMDVIVVGGGPAGLTAALVLARAGRSVMVVERGEYCGAKNVGGLLYGTVLNRLMPEFYREAPIERPVSKRTLVFLSDHEHAALQFGAEEWSRPPFNHTFIVHRSQFDRWYARAAEAAGANLIEGMVVDGLLYEGHDGDRRAVGVRLRGGEEFRADVVILADGANCLVSEEARAELRLRPGRVRQAYAVGVKEILGLPRERIEDRFQLGPEEGAAIDFFGSPFRGLIGGGFLYAAKESLHLGFAARIESLVRAGLSPHEVMEAFKAHPVVARMIRGAELLEYSAHMIPEGGYDAIGELSGPGVLIAGDAAGLVNMSLYKEGTNLAMESGALAAETAAEAVAAGDPSAERLAAYRRRLEASFVMKDLQRYRHVPEVLAASPDLLDLYPRKAVRLLADFFTVGYQSKAQTQRAAWRAFWSGLPKLRSVRDLARARRLV